MFVAQHAGLVNNKASNLRHSSSATEAAHVQHQGLNFKKVMAHLTAAGEGEPEEAPPAEVAASGGGEEAPEEGEEPMSEEERRDLAQQRAEEIQQARIDAERARDEAKVDFKDCILNCHRERREALRSAREDEEEVVNDDGVQCCNSAGDYFCLCFTGFGCCSGHAVPPAAEAGADAGAGSGSGSEGTGSDAGSGSA